MTLSQATDTPLRDLPFHDLWAAVQAIGAHKLAARCDGRVTSAMLEWFRPLNARIDALLAEEEWRRKEKTEARRVQRNEPPNP